LYDIATMGFLPKASSAPKAPKAPVPKPNKLYKKMYLMIAFVGINKRIFCLYLFS